uniref:histidine kinase n=1 Tax=Rhodopseudomonas palustris (strain DX-1) TaxID=652103 RepID=E6VKH8_RHOPX
MPNDDLPTRIAELEADNRRLRCLLDKRDAPGELRHRFRSTMAMLRTIVRKSAGTQRDLDSYVGHLEDRLDALMRAQAIADEQGAIDLHKLLADELLHYQARDGDRTTIAGPDLHLQPRAGQVVALAVHELAVNAVEHGALGNGGTIDITWSVDGEGSDSILTFIWKETDTAIAGAPSHNGFGTEVLTRTLVYELRAETDLAFESDGLRCTIRFPLSGRIGRQLERTIVKES